MRDASLRTNENTVMSLRDAILVATAILVTDFVAAQVLKAYPSVLVAPFTEYWEYSAEYHHDLIPNVETEVNWLGRRYRHRTNSLRFRDRTVRDVAPSSDMQRYLFIGDSFAEGIGLDYEDTAVGQIAETFGKEGIEVLNAGVFGYGPSIYHRKVRYLIEDKGLRFDRLFVMIDVSDISDEIRFTTDGQGNIHASDDFTRKWKYYLKTNSLIIRLIDLTRDWLRIDEAQLQFERTVGKRYGLEFSSWTFDDRRYEKYGRRGLEKSTRAKNQLFELVADRGIPMTVIVYPWPDQLKERDINSRHTKHWGRWANEKGVGFVNLFPTFGEAAANAEAIDDLFLDRDVHFNAKGNTILARGIIDFIRNEKPRAQ